MPNSKQGIVPFIRLAQSTALSMGFAEAAGAHSIGLVMYNAAQAEQAVQQIEIAALGYVLAKMASSAGG